MLRSPNTGNTNNTRNVNESGIVNNNNAMNSNGVVADFSRIVGKVCLTDTKNISSKP